MSIDTDHQNETARRLVDDLVKTGGKFAYSFNDISGIPTTKSILSANSQVQLAVLRECFTRIAAMRQKLGKPRPDDHRYMNLHHFSAFEPIAPGENFTG